MVLKECPVLEYGLEHNLGYQGVLSKPVPQQTIQTAHVSAVVVVGCSGGDGGGASTSGSSLSYSHIGKYWKEHKDVYEHTYVLARIFEREVSVCFVLSNYKPIYRRRDEPSIIIYNWPIKTSNRRGRQRAQLFQK